MREVNGNLFLSCIMRQSYGYFEFLRHVSLERNNLQSIPFDIMYLLSDRAGGGKIITKKN